MTDKPAESAVERWERQYGPGNFVVRSGDDIGRTVDMVGEDEADAAIAELKAKLAAAEDERDKYKWAAEQASEFYFVCKDKDEQREMGDDCGRKPYFWLYELEQVLARYQPGDAACRAYRPEPKED